MVSNIKCNIVVFLIIKWISYGIALPYPVFGTKRYHRSNVIPPVIGPVPVYSSVPQYFDGQGYDPYPYNIGSYGDESSYYYYPTRYEPVRSSYRTYGMPTYHGEYKPTPYYYAHGPTYSYYDDHVESPNPLDDLHEEMLQEDERERQRNLLPVGQETWYENTQRQDSMASANAAFLRNLIAYNKQLNAAKVNEPFESNEEFDDYVNDEEMYESQPELHYNSNYNNYNNYNSNPVTNPRINEIVDDDDDVRALKSLADKSLHQQKFSNNQRKIDDMLDHTVQQYDNQQSWHHSAEAPISPSQSSSYQQYDADPEYDDDSWINWDRKRNLKQSKSSDFSIFNFSDRKSKQILSTQNPLHIVKPTIQQKLKIQSSSTSTSTSKPSSPSTSSGDELEMSLKKLSGQKEVPLLRPASAQRHNFNLPLKEEDQEINNKRNSKDSVYDTIKQLLALEHHHEKVNIFSYY